MPVGADILVPLANGEPRLVVDALDQAAAERRLDGVRVHQMHAGYDHPYLHGPTATDSATSPTSSARSSVRPTPKVGVSSCPSHFSDMPRLLRRTTKCSLLVARAAPPDRHGFFSLGTNADYSARFLGEIPVFLEVDPNMPRTFGRTTSTSARSPAGASLPNRCSRCLPPRSPSSTDASPNWWPNGCPTTPPSRWASARCPMRSLGLLEDHRDLGIHTELLTDGVVDLIESGAATGLSKATRPGKVVTTFALGTAKTYDYIADNPVVEMLPVDWVNDPRVIGREPCFVSINSTLEVDFLGQCNSEVLNGRYWSGSGGQADFARGAMHSPEGQGFVVLHSTSRGHLDLADRGRACRPARP